MLQSVGNNLREDSIMKKAKHEITLEKLEKAGWKVVRRALYRGYKYAGTISPMRTKNGNEYCRVHIGHCKSARKHGYHMTFQETLVLYKPIV